MAKTITPTSALGNELLGIQQGADDTTTEYMYEPDFWMAHAMREIFNTYGDVVDVKPKSLEKFGENLLVGTSETTLMTLPVGVLQETYATTNAITHISSSDSGDTQTVTVEGHTVSGGLFTFVVQQVTLAGQTKTALGTPLARATRVANLGSTNNAGAIYVYEDDTVTGGVPDTAAKVHVIAPAGENQSLKAATTISDSDYWIVTQLFASVNEKTTAGAVIRLRVRNKGGVFRTLFKHGINSTGPNLVREFRPYLIIPQNSDVRLTAEADGASTPIAGGINGVLVTVRADTA